MGALGQDDASLRRSRREPRDLLVVSIRSDRGPVGDSWLDAVETYARRRRLRIHLVTQVRRDQSLALKLAERWGAECLLWEDDLHPEHEVKVRALYPRAALTISDRLHGLIIAMTEGAVPVGFAPNSAEKLSRSFMALGIDQVAFSASEYGRDEALARIENLEAGADQLCDRLAMGRSRLTQLSDEVIASFRSELAVY